MDAIEQLNVEHGITTILVTHEMEVALRARRVIRSATAWSRRTR